MAERSYPEHEKMKECSSPRQAVGDFIEWLSERGYWICEKRHGEWFPTYRSRDQLLAAHFELDIDKIDAEKRAMLDEIRAAAKSDSSQEEPS